MIRLFISSTFDDMQEEREWIRKYVYPRLREYGMKKGVAVDICDLRWGIYVDEDSSNAIQKIMEVCLWEVANCDPYIVAIIGNYHGTIPDSATQKSIAGIWEQLKGDRPCEREYLNWSLTQWELEYSFLSEDNSAIRAVCLFRKDEAFDADDDTQTDNKEALRSLKRKILKKTGNSDICVIKNEYSKNDKDEFIKLLTSKIESFIDEKANQIDLSNPAERAFAEADAYAEEKSQKFFGRKKAIEAFDSFCEEDGINILGYYGSSGIGKSSVMAHLYQSTIEKLSEDERYRVRFIACGVDEYNNDYLNVLKQIIYSIETYLDKNAKYPRSIYATEMAETKLRSVLYECAQRERNNQKPLILFIDALDKINGTIRNRILDIFQETREKIVWLVCSQIQPYELNRSQGMQTYEIGPLSKEEITEIMAGKLFNDYQSKEITEKNNNPAIDAALCKKNSNHPLYLDILITSLKMHTKELKDTTGRDCFIKEKINQMPDRVEDLCWETMIKAIEECDSSDGSDIRSQSILRMRNI